VREPSPSKNRKPRNRPAISSDGAVFSLASHAPYLAAWYTSSFSTLGLCDVFSCVTVAQELQHEIRRDPRAADGWLAFADPLGRP
jgi:hypothetical protein